jgi:hypothetical protein
MAAEFFDIDGDLFHNRADFGRAGVPVNDPALDVPDIGGYLVDSRGGFGHVARKLISDIEKDGSLFFDDQHEVFDLNLPFR